MTESARLIVGDDDAVEALRREVLKQIYFAKAEFACIAVWMRGSMNRSRRWRRLTFSFTDPYLVLLPSPG